MRATNSLRGDRHAASSHARWERDRAEAEARERERRLAAEHHAAMRDLDPDVIRYRAAKESPRRQAKEAERLAELRRTIQRIDDEMQRYNRHHDSHKKAGPKKPKKARAA